MTIREEKPKSMPDRTTKRILEPFDRISEVLFGLIMVLTFTGSLSVADAGRSEVRTMLIAAVGCNLAWGLIDALFYLMGSLSERAANLRTWQAVRQARTAEEAGEVIAERLPPIVASVMSPQISREIWEQLKLKQAPPERPTISRQDLMGAVAVFFLVVASTLPVALPFVFQDDAVTALRTSNAIAVSMMFVLGYAFGRSAGYRPLVTAISMVIVGCILVALTIALGG